MVSRTSGRNDCSSPQGKVATRYRNSQEACKTRLSVHGWALGAASAAHARSASPCMANELRVLMGSMPMPDPLDLPGGRIALEDRKLRLGFDFGYAVLPVRSRDDDLTRAAAGVAQDTTKVFLISTVQDALAHAVALTVAARIGSSN